MIMTLPNPSKRLNVGLEYVPVIAMSTRSRLAIEISAMKSPTQLPIASNVTPKKLEGSSVMNPIKVSVSTTKFDRNQIQRQAANKEPME